MKNKLAIGIIATLFVIAIVTVLSLLPNDRTVLTGRFSTDTTGLTTAKPSEVVELQNGSVFNLTAHMVQKSIGGHEVKMLAYNNMIPGPVIKVPQGAEITINFKNETDVPTTIHSHGVRLENQFDGVPHMTQKEIAVGGTYTYKIKFPDAGMYWYHPHVREDYAQELGLYGNYLVAPTDASYWSEVNREVPLFLDDLLITDGHIAPFYTKGADHALMGRFGNVLLINGEDDYRLDVKNGEVIRFYLTNAASTRPFNFAIAGARLKLVGGDNGAYEHEEWQDAVLLGPSERAVVEVLFDQPGVHLIQNKTPYRTGRLGTVVVSDTAPSVSYTTTHTVLRDHSAVTQSIDPFRAAFQKNPDKRLRLGVDLMGNMQRMMSAGDNGGHMMADGTMMGGMMTIPEGGIEWDDNDGVMNAASDTSNVTWDIIDEDTGQENMDINWKFKVGDQVKIRITNDAHSMHPMQHPIHFHGQRFLVLSRNGTVQNNLVWKDTVLIPAGQYVDILLDASNPGEWMAHCHISEHLEAGMMFGFTVE